MEKEAEEVVHGNIVHHPAVVTVPQESHQQDGAEMEGGESEGEEEQEEVDAQNWQRLLRSFKGQYPFASQPPSLVSQQSIHPQMPFPHWPPYSIIPQHQQIHANQLPHFTRAAPLASNNCGSFGGFGGFPGFGAHFGNSNIPETKTKGDLEKERRCGERCTNVEVEHIPNRAQKTITKGTIEKFAEFVNKLLMMEPSAEDMYWNSKYLFIHLFFNMNNEAASTKTLLLSTFQDYWMVIGWKTTVRTDKQLESEKAARKLDSEAKAEIGKLNEAQLTELNRLKEQNTQEQELRNQLNSNYIEMEMARNKSEEEKEAFKRELEKSKTELIAKENELKMIMEYEKNEAEKALARYAKFQNMLKRKNADNDEEQDAAKKRSLGGPGTL
ncbi:hypothetical protein B9Z55_028342 [Caenorhabditis nigoni]|uniref:Uncharacterized protein n=1 Tax=Caenorhabditis nigoni TaxID=1611254 RepID=A0A2G5SCF5_9PELO|nr:hypothetical protein B9Z55_028342 [Caenorhabditis nigoni]